MKTYTVFLRILGGEWNRYPFIDGSYETHDLALALGLAATLADPIKETMVVSVEIMPACIDEPGFIRKTYELIQPG